MPPIGIEPTTLLDAFTSSGAYVIYGVVAGGLTTGLVQVVGYFAIKRKRAKHLAQRTVIALDEYIESASNVFNEPVGVGLVSSEGTQLRVPESFREPADVDWLSIDAKLAYNILRLAGRHATVVSTVQFLRDVADESEAKRVCDQEFGQLIRDADSYASKLRTTYKLPLRDTSTWDPMEPFRIAE